MEASAKAKDNWGQLHETVPAENARDASKLHPSGGLKMLWSPIW